MPTLIAVLAANLLTAMFICGIYKVSRVKDEKDAGADVYILFLVPLSILGLGLYGFLK